MTQQTGAARAKTGANRRLKVLHVVFSLDPGGMENGLVNVAAGLDPAAFDVHVCCLERRGSFAERLPDPSQVYVFDKPPGKSLKTALQVARLVRRLRPDVVHSHNLGPLIYSVLGTGCGLMAPVLQGEHGTLPTEELVPGRLRQRARLYRFCRRIHTVSGALTEHLVDLGFPSDRMVTILNGVDTERYKPGDRLAARRQIGLPDDGVYVGLVGRFIRSKRHAMLFDAMARVAATGLPVRVLVVGDGGADAAEIRAAAAASPIASRIHLVGFQAEPLAYYRAMDLLAVPSDVEGLSNAVLEAMSCGVPVLSNEVCGSREVITSGVDGLLAPMASVDALTTALTAALASPPQLHAMGQQARETILQRFGIAAMVRAYAEVYRAVAANGRG